MHHSTLPGIHSQHSPVTAHIEQTRRLISVFLFLVNLSLADHYVDLEYYFNEVTDTEDQYPECPHNCLDDYYFFLGIFIVMHGCHP